MNCSYRDLQVVFFFFIAVVFHISALLVLHMDVAIFECDFRNFIELNAEPVSPE